MPTSFRVAASEIASRPAFLAGPLVVELADVFAAAFVERPLPVSLRTLDAARDTARLLLAMTESPWLDRRLEPSAGIRRQL